MEKKGKRERNDDGTDSVDGPAVSVEEDSHALLQKILRLSMAHVCAPLLPEDGDAEVGSHACRSEVPCIVCPLKVCDAHQSVRIRSIREENKRKRKKKGKNEGRKRTNDGSSEEGTHPFPSFQPLTMTSL